MIRESIVEGQSYAWLHGSIRDRAKARVFKVMTVPPSGGYVEGFFDEEGSNFAVVAVHVRLLRGTWADWLAGKEERPKQYRRRNPAGWLRRLVADPDAGPELREAARKQLATL